jgi:phenylalanyl-tRNA synthetase beta chain
MRVPLRWLGELVDLPADRGELVHRLTQGGLEVEAVLEAGPALEGIRVGRVIECERHPDADRLSLCSVEVGEGEPVPIVCGAPNVAAGQKVAVALPGTRLPDGTRIKRSKIRGVVSNGMICSARELGLGDEHAGILVLDPAAPVGAAFSEVQGAGDAVLEIALTPNRGDCASLLGIAREVRAHFGGSLRLPPVEPEEEGDPAALSVRVEIEDPAGCYRYVARLVRGVRVGPSPPWLRERLEAAGLRAINVVVDVTNAVLLELGQPLHAFDASTLRGGVVKVRRALPDEKLATLDGETRVLDPEDLVIADAERAIAVAGVMGGAETEVGDETTDVLIESAHFDPVRVRRAARRLGLATEASYRFEREVDRAGIRRAADRAARLLGELAGGSVAPGAVEVVGDVPPAVEAIELDPDRVNRLLGTALGAGEIAALLERLEVRAEPTGAGQLCCRVPTHRNDLRQAADLVEEVARIHGYDRIPTTLPSERLLPVHQPVERRIAEQARDTLRAAGLVECMTLPLTNGAALDRIGLPADDPRRRAVAVLNPLVEDESQLRSTLVPAILEVARQNRARQLDRVRVFEIGHVFRPRSEGRARPGADTADTLPEERPQLVALITAGERRLWDVERPLYFELKGVFEQLLGDLGLTGRFRPDAGEPYLHPGASAAVEVGDEVVGALGELHPETASRCELEGPCALLVLDLTALAGKPPAPIRYREVSRQPSVRRDLAVLLPGTTAAQEVLDAIRATAGPHLVSAEIFDRYEGTGVPEGKVSVAFRLVFQRPDRTLRDAEVSRAAERVVAMLADRFQGELRQSSIAREEPA